MQLPRRSVRSIQELPNIRTAFPVHYKPVRTHSASTASNSARSPDIEDGLEVVPLERNSVLSAPIVSGCLDEKEVFISSREMLEKPLPSIPTSIWRRIWGRMSVKYRVLAVLCLLALVLLTVGIALFSASSKHKESDHGEVRRNNATNTSSETPLERGTFSVPIQMPQQQSSTCLAQVNESRAWQCAFDMNLQLTILPSIGDDDNPVMITLGLPSKSNRTVHCGQQAPEVGPTALTSLTDIDDGSYYQFSTTYDRTVILREDQLGQETTTPSAVQGQPKHTTFLPGQTLWRCTFNDTLLEGSIYTEEGAGLVPTTTNATAGSGLHLPYKLKLIERRVATGSAPYCEKVVVGGNGELGDGGEKIDLTWADGQTPSGSDSTSSDAACQCQWAVE